jgi:hypothetical protein
MTGQAIAVVIARNDSDLSGVAQRAKMDEAIHASARVEKWIASAFAKASADKLLRS